MEIRMSEYIMKSTSNGWGMYVGELTRCKDCKYFTRYKDCIEMYMRDGDCSEWASHTYLDWFCSRAERREDANS